MVDQLDIFPELKELEELKQRVSRLEEELALLKPRWARDHTFYPNTIPLPTTDKLLPAPPVDTPKPYYYTVPPVPTYEWPYRPPFEITCFKSEWLQKS